MAPKRKVHSLTGRITMVVMHRAFKAVRRNRGAAGVDKQSISMYEENLEANLASLMRKLKTRGAYRPKPLRRVHIPKGKGKTRPLGIPAVEDRVAQEVLRSLLEPIWEPTFHEHSYGFRPGRSCHGAIEKVLEIAKDGYRVVLDADIKGFFDHIPHELITDLVADRVADGNILGILRRLLTSGVMEDGKLVPTTAGTPQGGVISPLLANIVLDQLDHALTEHGYRHVRYADDFVVLCRTRADAEEALALVRTIIEDQLGLRLSPEKTGIRTLGDGFDFLGFRLKGSRVTMRPKSVERLRDNVRKLTVRSHNLDAELITKLNRVLRGTANYFVAPWSNVLKQFKILDKWIRMRLRCVKRKRISRLNNVRLPNRWFERRGLLSLEAICRAVYR